MARVESCARVCLFRWDLSAKPSQPVARFRHSGAVTGLHALNGRHLLSGGMDARLLLWDVRRPAQPLRDLVSLDRRRALFCSMAATNFRLLLLC